MLVTKFEASDRPDPHMILDRLSLIKARRHVAMIAADPTLVPKAQIWLRDESRPIVVYRYWRFLLGRRPLEMALRLLVEDSARGRWVRSGNPFSMVAPMESEEKRRVWYRRAKREVAMAFGPLRSEFAARERREMDVLEVAMAKAVARDDQDLGK